MQKLPSEPFQKGVIRHKFLFFKEISFFLNQACIKKERTDITASPIQRFRFYCKCVFCLLNIEMCVLRSVFSVHAAAAADVPLGG